MQGEPGHDGDRDDREVAPTGAGSGPSAADANPEHDDTTSREAFEREMAEQGRSDEAAQHGDHIE